MVFDFVAQNKSCLFFNYEQPQLKNGIRDVGQNYNYIHFRSMPSKDAVLWIFDKNELTNTVKTILDGQISSINQGKKWFDIIVGLNPTSASEKIWDAIAEIIDK